jgi:hypothetical protein
VNYGIIELAAALRPKENLILNKFIGGDWQACAAGGPIWAGMSPLLIFD